MTAPFTKEMVKSYCRSNKATYTSVLVVIHHSFLCSPAKSFFSFLMPVKRQVPLAQFIYLICSVLGRLQAHILREVL